MLQYDEGKQVRRTNWALIIASIVIAGVGIMFIYDQVASPWWAVRHLTGRV